MDEIPETDEIYTIGKLKAELEDFPDDALVMVVVHKYPSEFAIKADLDGEFRWDLGTDVEVRPLEVGDVNGKDNQCWLIVELSEYNADRAMLNGASAETE